MKRDKRAPGKAPTAKTETKSQWRRHALILIVILVALLGYSNSFHAPFLLDNNEIILKDTRVHAATSENVDRILGSPYYQSILAGLYRPLTTLSFLYNYAVLENGTAPEGYHWLNFLLHAGNIALVYALGLLLFDEIPAALALAALWGLHPVLTDAVTNIVGRADMLAAFGVLAAVLCYHRSLLSRGAGRPLWLAAMALVTTVGMFSKESAIVAIAAVALYDLIFARSAEWRLRIAGYAAVAVPVIVFLAIRARVLGRFPAGPFPFTDNPLIGASFWSARLAAFQVIGKYFGLLLWPAHLAPDYSYNEIHLSVGAKAIVPLALCALAGTVAILCWNRARPLAFAILFFFATLAPVSNVFVLIGSIMGERFLYLPSVGFASAVVFGARAIWRKGPRYRAAVYAVLGIVLVAFAIRAHNRNADWLDDRRFWRAAAAATPGNYKALITEAATTPLDKREDRERAALEADRAMTILNGLPDAWNSAYAYRQAGVLFREIGDRYTTKRAAPDGTDPMQYYQRSWAALMMSERVERAIDQVYREENARRGTPRATFLPSVIYLELGRTYLRMLNHGEALANLERGRNLESDPDLLEELGRTYEALEQPRKAAQAFIEALAMDSTRSYLNQKLIDLYGKIDPQGCPVTREGGTTTLNIACPLVHDDLCGATRNVAQNFERRNQTAEAASIRHVAVADLGCPASP